MRLIDTTTHGRALEIPPGFFIRLIRPDDTYASYVLLDFIIGDSLSLAVPLTAGDRVPIPKPILEQMAGAPFRIKVNLPGVVAGSQRVVLAVIESEYAIDDYYNPISSPVNDRLVVTQGRFATCENNVIANYMHKNVPGLDQIPCLGYRSATIELPPPYGAFTGWSQAYCVSVTEVHAGGERRKVLPLAIVPNRHADAPNARMSVDFDLSGGASYLQVRVWRFVDGIPVQVGDGADPCTDPIVLTLHRGVLSPPYIGRVSCSITAASAASLEHMGPVLMRPPGKNRVIGALHNAGPNTITSDLYAAYNMGTGDEDHHSYFGITNLVTTAGALARFDILDRAPDVYIIRINDVGPAVCTSWRFHMGIAEN